MKSSSKKYTCNEYRAEMVLLGLNQQLHRKDLTPEERQKIQAEIDQLEADMGMA